MKVFVWDELRGLTDRYHDGGGAFVVASSVVEAWLLLRDEVTDKEYLDERHPYGVEPTWVGELRTGRRAVHEPKVIIFPDAGCC